MYLGGTNESPANAMKIAKLELNVPKESTSVTQSNVMNNKKKQKISLAQYLKQNSNSGEAEDNAEATESLETLPKLPEVNELFQDNDAFEPEQSMPQQSLEQDRSSSTCLEQEDDLEPKQVKDELEYFLGKKSNKVSSWTVSKTSTCQRSNSLEDQDKYKSCLEDKLCENPTMTPPKSDEDSCDSKTCDSSIQNWEAQIPSLGQVSSSKMKKSKKKKKKKSQSCTGVIKKSTSPSSLIVRIALNKFKRSQDEVEQVTSTTKSTEEAVQDRSMSSAPQDPQECFLNILDDVQADSRMPSSRPRTFSKVFEDFVQDGSSSPQAICEEDFIGTVEILDNNETDVILVEQEFLDEPTTVAQVEVRSMTDQDPHAGTMTLINGVDKSIDFCPKCGTKLCPVRGGYSVNCVTFDVYLTCFDCSTKVVIKEAFNDKEKSTLWMSSIF